MINVLIIVLPGHSPHARILGITAISFDIYKCDMIFLSNFMQATNLFDPKKYKCEK
jgi:hypothetical protein